MNDLRLFILAALASSLTILIRYSSIEKFEWSAYFIHITAFMFAFVMMGLLATDLAFTLKNRATNDLENQNKFNGLMNVLWFVVYWGNLIFGSGVIKFF